MEDLNEQYIGATDLQKTMNMVLANTFCMYLLAQKYHWNVEGANFSQYHDFFGNLYEQLFEEIDKTAEQIRALGYYAPGTLKEFDMMSSMSDSPEIPGPKMMFARLYAANTSMIDALTGARSFADREGKFGLVNYLEDRLDKHSKIGWMLKSHMVGQEHPLSLKPTD